MDALAAFFGSIRDDAGSLVHQIKNGPKSKKEGDLRRGVNWRFFCGLLDPASPQTWEDALEKNKESYTTRKNEIMKDPSHQEDEDLEFCNPLSVAEDNPYQEFYKVTQLINEIDLDLDRCCIDGVPDDFFQQENILTMMRGVLTVWSTENPDTSYRQGMHEVLGAVLLALLPLQELRDADGEGEDADILRQLADAAQLEADAHFIFNYIMKDLQLVYRVQTDAERKAQIAKIKAAAKLSAGGSIGASTDGLSMKAPLQVTSHTTCVCRSRCILILFCVLRLRLCARRFKTALSFPSIGNCTND